MNTPNSEQHIHDLSAESSDHDPNAGKDDNVSQENTPVILEDYVVEMPLPGSKDKETRYLSLREAIEQPLPPGARRKRRTVRYNPEENIMMNYWIDNIDKPQPPRELGAQIGDQTSNSVKSKVTKYLTKLSEDPLWGGLLDQAGTGRFRMYGLGFRPRVEETSNVTEDASMPVLPKMPDSTRKQRQTKKMFSELLGGEIDVETLPDMGNSGLKFEINQEQLGLSHKGVSLDMHGETLKIFAQVTNNARGIFFDKLLKNVNATSQKPMEPLRLMHHLEYIQTIFEEQGISGWTDGLVDIEGRQIRLIHFNPIRFVAKTPDTDAQ